jgi:hypothetical protein
LRKYFRENYFRKDMTKNIPRKIFFRDFGEKIAQMFSRKNFHVKKNKKFPRKFSRKKVHHSIRENMRKNFAQNFFAIKFATIFFAIINSYNYFSPEFSLKVFYLNL